MGLKSRPRAACDRRVRLLPAPHGVTLALLLVPRRDSAARTARHAGWAERDGARQPLCRVGMPASGDVADSVRSCGVGGIGCEWSGVRRRAGRTAGSPRTYSSCVGACRRASLSSSDRVGAALARSAARAITGSSLSLPQGPDSVWTRSPCSSTLRGFGSVRFAKSDVGRSASTPAQMEALDTRSGAPIKSACSTTSTSVSAAAGFLPATPGSSAARSDSATGAG
jgi:hypothetical protein